MFNTFNKNFTRTLYLVSKYPLKDKLVKSVQHFTRIFMRKQIQESGLNKEI